MNKIIMGALAAACAAATIGVAAPAQAAPFDYTDNPSPFDTNPSPFDFTGDTIELPFFGEVTFIGNGTEFGPGYQGVKGPRGADTTGPRSHGNPSG
ncbi:hypothetical protein C6A86_003020 [Mycobacterium sp. ITM-2016-00316]|uniref:hypothetical protein n=1 Tax=Mycobacterium sp. ITM-2016-00316 TaxID=2099695 RepID=UPI000CF8A370|nr:hypothetical protein [Mycobacterium sp. ITM-2016-00316]WNG82694.1 hypothetical protein C6A86_003020 [Mycobacterium sp. ITM-2016-00316]